MLTNSDIDAKNYDISSEDTRDILKTIKATGEVTEAYSTTWFRIFLVNALQTDLDTADKYLYPLVKEEVLVGITDPLERNRLTSFHRVAKHLVKKYIQLKAEGASLPNASNTTKAHIIREWNNRVKSVTDPVTELRVAFAKIAKRALILEGEGNNIIFLKDDVSAFLHS
jgi:hypothetical protein